MGCMWLMVLGGALEEVGFACIVAELARIQWREFGTPEVAPAAFGQRSDALASSSFASAISATHAPRSWSGCVPVSG
jgi:hypothetical protein